MPPPYSWTRVRAPTPAGVTSAIPPSGPRRTTTQRPSSSGRASFQYKLSPMLCGHIGVTPPSAISTAVIGERHEP